MKNYFVWCRPHPNWKSGDKLFPQSCQLHFIAEDFDRDTLVKMTDKPVVVMSEDEIDAFLRHDAEHWAWMKADNPAGERFDAKYAIALFDAMKHELATAGKLDFSKINAGVKI